MIEFPKIIPQSMNVGLASNSKIFESTFNKSTTAVKFAGDAITLDMSFSSLDYGDTFSYDEANDMSAFLFELGGRSGIAKIPMFHRPGKPALGSPILATNDQLGGSVDTNGWSPNQLVLKRGDFVTLNHELKMVMKDVVSSATGSATLSVIPWLRAKTVTGTEVITQDPYGLFRIKEDDSDMEITPMNGSTSLSFKEAFYV